MGVDIAADGSDLALDFEGARHDGHELLQLKGCLF
jgi:hypothetical protein